MIERAHVTSPTGPCSYLHPLADTGGGGRGVLFCKSPSYYGLLNNFRVMMRILSNEHYNHHHY